MRQHTICEETLSKIDINKVEREMECIYLFCCGRLMFSLIYLLPLSDRIRCDCAIILRFNCNLCFGAKFDLEWFNFARVDDHVGYH